MSSEDDLKKGAPRGEDESDSGWKLSWKRFFDYAKNLIDLERSVAALKSQNKEIRRELQPVQRQLDMVNGELKALSKFVSGAIDDKIDAKVNNAEIRAFERLPSMVRGSTRGIE
jgi:predicted RNase H-like nuclease (RuvC/YqgF family)